MAFEQPGFKVTREAGADLSGSQFRAVKLNDQSQVVVITAITDVPFAILQDKPAALGRAAELMMSGISLMEAGGTIDEDDMIGVTNTGRGVAIVIGTDTTQYIVGRALTPAATGELFSLSFNLSQPNRAT